METVILKTGVEVPRAFVEVATGSLESLLESYPIAFYELVMLCRDSNHELFGNTDEILRVHGLIEADDQPHDIIRLVVLASVDGEGLDLKLVSPLAEIQAQKKVVKQKVADLYDFDLYQAARRVADVIFEYIDPRFDPKSDKPWKDDRRREEVNPYHHQTANGLFLEFYYGSPSSLRTPWGEWHFSGSGSGSWEKITPELLKRFGATLHEPERTSQMGVFGPVYALHKVDEVTLPEPTELDPLAYASYDEAKEAWEELTKRYMSRK